jgi:hypothetical protein
VRHHPYRWTGGRITADMEAAQSFGGRGVLGLIGRSWSGCHPRHVPPWRMIDLTVRVLGQEDWPLYRAVRLAALQESPNALGATLDLEASADDHHWRAQMTAARRLVVELDGRVCGVVSVDRFSEEPESADLSGLWADPSARSTVSRVGSWKPRSPSPPPRTSSGCTTGWAPRTLEGSASRPAPGSESPHAAEPPPAPRIPTTGDTEIALVLPLEDDPATVPNAAAGGFGRPDPGAQPGRR